MREDAATKARRIVAEGRLILTEVTPRRVSRHLPRRGTPVRPRLAARRLALHLPRERQGRRL
jgi:hypothetical protein